MASEQTSSSVIRLSNRDLIIAEGTFSICYQHPEHPDICIKRKTTNARASKRLRADLAYFRKLHKKKTDLTHIADHLGPCSTDLGPGELFECILDFDGNRSMTLAAYMEQHPTLLPVIFQELEKLARYLMANRILVSDLHSQNILIQRTSENDLKAVIIDGLGDRVLIPILNVFRSRLDAKIIRRWNRFLDRLKSQHPSLSFPDGLAYLPPSF